MDICVKTTMKLSFAFTLVLEKVQQPVGQEELFIILFNLDAYPEPVFVNVFGGQDPIPRNRFHQLMKPGGPVRLIGLSYRPARLGTDSWAP
jgi:hypothetical protein